MSQENVEIVRRSVDHWNEAGESLRDELLPAGDLVVSLGGVRMRGALSGASAVQNGCGVWELRERRIVRVRMYFDREEALEAAGLSE